MVFLFFNKGISLEFEHLFDGLFIFRRCHLRYGFIGFFSFGIIIEILFWNSITSQGRIIQIFTKPTNIQLGIQRHWFVNCRVNYVVEKIPIHFKIINVNKKRKSICIQFKILSFSFIFLEMVFDFHRSNLLFGISKFGDLFLKRQYPISPHKNNLFHNGLHFLSDNIPK